MESTRRKMHLARLADQCESVSLREDVELTLRSEVIVDYDDETAAYKGYVTRVETDDRKPLKQVWMPCFMVKLRYEDYERIMSDSLLKTRFYERFLLRRSYDEAEVTIEKEQWKYFIYRFHVVTPESDEDVGAITINLPKNYSKVTTKK